MKFENEFESERKYYALNFGFIKSKRMLLIMFLCFCLAIFKRKSNKIYQILKNNIINIPTFGSNINENIVISYNNKINNYDNKNYKIFLKDGKLYWNNETSLGLEKIKEEISMLKQIQILFKKKIDFIRRENPKISIIITIYNQEKFIKSIYACIQKQSLKNIEIIFIDDNSKDRSSLLINELMKKDKRITYLKNNNNKGPFISRNKGILIAKGEYILVIDPDDLLVNNILLKAYETAKQYNLDILQFYVLRGYYESPEIWKNLKNKGGILNNNSEIRNNFYHCISRNLWDKLVKKNIYIKAINFMRKEFYNEIYYINNDNTAFFGLIHVANTYGFLEQIGYFYIFRPKGEYYYRSDPKKMNLIYKSIFNNMKYFYIQTDNNISDKYYLAYRYFESSMITFGKYLQYVTDGFKLFFDVFDLYLNSTYFNDNQKKKLNDFKFKFIKMKKINEFKEFASVHIKII